MHAMSQPSDSIHTLSRHWTPLATRTPWLMILCVAVLACIATIEVGLRTNIDSSASNTTAARLVRKQEVDTPTSTTDNGIETISINEDLPETTETYAETDDFMTLTSLSSTNDDTVTTTQEPVTGTSALPEDFLTLTTSSAGGPIATGTASAISRITVPNADASMAPSTLEVIPTVVTIVTDGATAVISTSTTVPAKPDPTASSVKSSQVQLSASFGKFHYALATYLGVVVAVVLKLSWSLTFSGLKMMEPFHQLSKEGGATAKESLTSDFLSPSYGLSHLRHIFSGHWAMLFSTMTCIVIGTLSPLSSELMSIVATQVCPTSSGRSQACAPVWVINTPSARILQVVLLLTASLIILVIFFGFRRKSGVFSNPSSIATLASLLSHDSVRHDLQGVDQSSADKDILATLEGNRYVLTSATNADGQHRYGIVNAKWAQDASPLYGTQSLLSKEHFTTASRATDTSLARPSRGSGAFPQWKRMLRDTVFGGLILALFSTVLAYYLIGGRGTFNNFFNSKAFGPRFLLTTAASIIDFAWKTLEREVRIMTPYRQLGAGGVSADKSVLVDVGGLPTSSIWGAFRRREYIHAVVAVTAILSDILIIAVSGVPLADAQILEAFRYSSWISMIITAWMLIVMAAVFWWRMQVRGLGMPREPDTILAVSLMLADKGNKVVSEYNDWALVRGGKRDSAARWRGNKYSGGWKRLNDGSERWCIGVDEGHSTTFER